MPRIKKIKNKNNELNTSQLEAVEHESEQMLVIAGAGTGKTRVITERIKHLIQNEKVDPDQILALTFTDKASQEMVDRIGDIMPLGYKEPWVHTFHSFADRILREEGLEIGIDPSYKIISDPEQWLLLRKNIFKIDLEYFRPLGNPNKFISAVLKFISRLQDENISPEEFSRFTQENNKSTDTEENKRNNELSLLYNKYNELKLSDSKFDFGDLIIWTLRLFSKRPLILEKYRKQFKHILVDEFQDTNIAQYELIKLLCPGKMKERTLTVVGDDSQSIYKFRGAAVSNIIQFMNDYPKAKMITLIQNYRSTQKILDPAYKVIQNNNPDTLESALGISKALVAEMKGKGIDPLVIHSDTWEEEVNSVIEKIKEILDTKPEYSYRDIAILARANNHLEPFMMALRKENLPYQLVGNRGLYDREEIRDLLSLVKTILNPKDSVSLYRCMNIKSFNIPYRLIVSMLSEARFNKIPLWEVLQSNEDKNMKLFLKKISDFQKSGSKDSPSRFIYDLIANTNYLHQYLENETIENQLCIKNIDIFLKRAQKFEVEFYNDEKRMPSVLDFIDYLDLMIEAGDNPAQAELEDIDTINLMTVHASKGLEFPVVFIVNMVSDRFPTRNRGDLIEIPDSLIKEVLPSGDEHIQEERRLFYVGMTRAKKYLYITYADNYGGKRQKTPSGFINETGLKIFNFKSEKENSVEVEQTALFGLQTGFRNYQGEEAVDSLPKTLSYSQIEKFRVCPLQYKYAYILKIPGPPNHALSFGDTIHKCLRDFHHRKMFGEDLTLENLLKIYDDNWQPIGYQSEEHRNKRYESGKKLLENYYNKHHKDNIKHVGLEKTFYLNLAGYKFTGKIDRLDQLEDGVEIIDYKTGGIKDQKEVDNDNQVTIYAIAAKESLGLNPKILSLYYVEHGEKLSTVRNESQLEKLTEEVEEIVNEMKEGNFEATPGMHCAFCDYRSICPHTFKS